jgi:hypothetical protein
VLSADGVRMLVVAILALVVPPLLAENLRADDPTTPALGSRLRILADQEFVGRLIRRHRGARSRTRNRRLRRVPVLTDTRRN